MATKVEKLSQETLTELAQLQDKVVKSASNIGELHLRLRDLKKETERLETLRTQIEGEVDETNSKFNKIIQELRDKYPTGQINLQTGDVTIEDGE
jgi:predicted nuclease with TOPRIM domain